MHSLGTGPKERIMVIANPASSHGRTRRRWPEIEGLFKQERLEYESRFTRRPGDAACLTSEALRGGYREIVCVGGDGTLSEVVTGFFNENGEPLNPEANLSVISMGTGSDFSRTLGLSRELIPAVQRIKKGTPTPLDVGRAHFLNNKGEKVTWHFINILGLGLDGETVERVNRTSKAAGGFLSFLWGAVVSLLLYRPKEMQVIIDGKELMNQRITLLVIANGRYFGGGMKIAPTARMDDGLFDIVVVEGINKFLLLSKLYKVYQGSHLPDPRVWHFRGQKVAVYAREEVLIDMDGEQPGKADLEVEILPASLKVRI